MAKKNNKVLINKIKPNNKRLKKTDLITRLKFYKTIFKIPKKLRCLIIPYLCDNSINLLCEALHNSVNINLGIKGIKKKTLIKELKGCSSTIKYLCKKSNCIKKRKNYLCQKGEGFLGPLLNAVIPVIWSLIKKKQ